MELALSSVLELVKALAAEQGEDVLDRWSSIGPLEFKDRRDMRAPVELEVERNVIRHLQQSFPDHGFSGEETGHHGPDTDYQWLIDPIDGTKNYVARSSLFSISIGLLWRNDPVLGVVYDCTSRQCFSAYRGGGAFLDNQRLTGSTVTQLSTVLANVDTPRMDSLPPEERAWFEMKLIALTRELYRIRSLGAGSLAACWLATGALDAYLDLTGYVKPEDLAAGRVIMQEAGAIVEYVNVPVGPPRLVAASPPLYHPIRSLLLADVSETPAVHAL